MIAPDLTPDDFAVLDLIAGQHSRLTVVAAWHRLLRREALARAIRGSCAIEGFNVSVDDAFAALGDEKPSQAGGCAWQAVRSYGHSMKHALELAEQLRKIDLDTIRALHSMIQQNDVTRSPGRWRSGPVFVHDGEMIVYEGPDAASVPGLMAELVEGVNSDTGSPLPVRAAVAQQPGRDATAWVRFCLTAHHRQALVAERRQRLAAVLWQESADSNTANGLQERCVEPLAFGLTGRVLRNSTYRQLVPEVSHNLARRDLNELVKAGLLEPIGEKRGRRYVPGEAMRLTAKTARDAVNHECPVTGDPYELIGARS